MNYFRYKQFNKDVITVAVGYYLRYALSYRELPFCIKFGRKNIKKRIISGVLMRHISKLKDSGVICIARLMQMDIH